MNINRMINKGVFAMKKHSPEILLVAGITGVVASGVMACMATTKLDEVLEETRETLDKLHGLKDTLEEAGSDYASRGDLTDAEIADLDKVKDYVDTSYGAELTKTYVRGGFAVAKLYGPSIVLGTLSIGSILTSNKIMKTRNLALSAAYATVSKSFADYKNRVVAKFGEEVEKELRYGVQKVEVEETVVDEKGKEKTVKKEIDVVENPGDYTFFFDAASRCWEKDPEYNECYLRQAQDALNDKLRVRGWLVLNEALELLDIPQTRAGMVVGWVYDENDPVGDNRIDFGIYNKANRRFANGYEPVIMLDFNVDGNVYEIMSKRNIAK